MTAPETARRSWRELVAEQEGVLSRHQALLGGLTPDQWQWQLDTRRWQPVVPGVVVTHSGPVEARQHSWAAVLHAGPGAALSGDAALVELGMRLAAPSALDVAVPEDRIVRRQAVAQSAPAAQGTPSTGQELLVVPHRVRHLDRMVHPVRVPPMVRVAPAVLHAAAWARSGRAAEWRVAAAVQQRLVLPADLRAALADLPRLPRRRLLLTVLDDVEQGAHALSELDFLRFLRRHDLPAPDQLQRPVRLGRLRYLDAWWERQRVSAEIDGAHHRTVGAWDDDVLRSNDVVVAGRPRGVLVLRFTTGNLRHDGPRVAAQLARALR